MKSAPRKRDVDMTEGSISKHLISFAFPLLLGNIFQTFYNTVDTWVVGNYASNEAFSAVGSVGPIINMLIGLFSGLASGAGVVISQYYGAHDNKSVHDAVHTSLLLTLILSIVLTVIGVLITPFMVRFMKTPAEVVPECETYLTIYFSGMIGLLFYNMGSGILRAVGDSMRPFIFLVVSALLNIVLDLVFVIQFGLGVAGVAYATILSQFISAVLVILLMMRTDSCVKFIPRDLKLHPDLLKKTVRVGIPASLQMAITSFSNVFVQSYINHFGTDLMSGWTAYSKIDPLIFLPMQSLALSSTTFVGQNLGKGDIPRAKKGIRVTLTLAVGSTLVISAIVLLFAGPVVAFFNPKKEVVELGKQLLYWQVPFYSLCCFNQIYSGALRGAGNSRTPMIIMLSSFVAFRQIYLYAVSHIFVDELIPVALAYPMGWVVCSILTFTYYKKVGIEKNRLMER